MLPIRRDGQLHELHAVSGITRGLSAPKKGAFGLSRGLSETGPFDATWAVAGLASLGTWEAGDLRGDPAWRRRREGSALELAATNPIDMALR